MRIAFVCYQMFGIGGIRVYGRQLLNRFVRSGHDVVVFSRTPTRRQPTGLDSRIGLILIPTSAIPLTRALSFWIQLRRAIQKEERRGKFDIIHSNSVDDVLVSKRDTSKTPRVVTVHHLGASVGETARRGHFNRTRAIGQEFGPLMLAEAVCIQRADHVIAVSQFTRSEVLRHYSTLSPQKVTTIYNGISRRFTDTDPVREARLKKNWTIAGEDRVLLFVGRLEERKGVRFLLQSIAQLPPEEKIKLVLIGDGNQEPYRRLVRRLGIDERVEFAGYVPDSDLAAAYNLADVVVNPSLMEGFGFAIAEAIVHGTPVVATNVGSIGELVRNGIDGVLVDYGDVYGFSKAILKTLNSATTARPEGDGNLERAFSWDKAASETLSLYRKLII